MRIFIRTLLVLAVLTGSLHLISCRVLPDREENALAVYPDDLEEVPHVRILVREALPEVTISVKGTYELRAEPRDPENPSLGGGKGPVTVTIKPTAKGMILGNPTDPRSNAPYPRITVSPLGNSVLKVDGVNYGGAVTLMRVVPKGEGGERKALLSVIARVDLERYLVGVVPHEMPSHWPVEALRAQCVAGRSYALYKIKTRAHLDFDVRDTTASQVWRPTDKGSPIINMVVNSTRGVVVTDNFRLFPTYYSAQCGGETKDGADVFISRHISPLTGVKCPYCQDSPTGARRWKFELTLSEVRRRLAENGYSLGRITDIDALDNHSRPMDGIGRVYDLTLEHEGSGRMLTIPAMNFRRALGAGRDDLASTFFSIRVRDGVAYFTGRGDGHGVGMCQYGSRYLAKQGYTYRQILEHYYRGNTLVRLW